MFQNVKRYEVGLESIPILVGVKTTLLFVEIPERKDIDSKPNKKGKTFPLVRWNNVKLVDFAIVKKSVVDMDLFKILSNMELGTISNIDLTKAMSNKLMDCIDTLGIQLNQPFYIEKIEGTTEFENTITITKK